MTKLVKYYREFNKEVLTKPEESLALLAYVAAHGDENVALYEHKSKSKGDISDELRLRETHKYSLYSRFDSIVFDEGVTDLSLAQQEKVIDIDWSQIDTENLSLESSEQWTVLQPPSMEPFQQVEEVDLGKFNNEETVLYAQETRQKLVNDLEECEFFLRQRLVELSSKDQAQYSMYLSDKQEGEAVKACDNIDFVKKALAQIEKVCSLLNHRDLLNFLLLRSKPK